jgi:FAD/FMN-containing dehydrogenase
MAELLDFDEEDGDPRVTVEPGLVHDDLQKFLRERGLFLPADPSSGAYSVLGGNIATKSSGPHALKHGSIDRYLQHLQFVTAEGEVVDTADEPSIPDPMAQGVLAVRDAVLADDQAVQRLDRRKGMKLASGYNLFTFLRHRNLGEMVAQLLVGSVGTLGIVTQATLRAESYVEGRATTLLYFRDLAQAGEAVLHIKDLDVAAIEIVNHTSLTIVKERRPELELPDGEAHMLLIEYEGPARYEQIARVEELVRTNGYAMVGEVITVEDKEERDRLWQVRKALLPTIRAYRRDLKALSVVNDVGVDVIHLADLIRDVEAIFARLGLVAAMYGHAGSGNLHLRPLFEVDSPDLPALVARVADEVYELVLGYEGTITAEHGMGRLRAPYLTREWGATMTGYMRQVKEAFDPQGVLNPEVMFSDRALTDDMKPV